MNPIAIASIQRELKKLLSVTEPIQIGLLQKLVDHCTRDAFLAIVNIPFLIGSGILSGHADPRRRHRENGTLCFIVDDTPENIMSDSISHFVYPLTIMDLSEYKSRQIIHIGGAQDNDIVLPDASISQKHATITKAEDGLYLCDLESSNGVSLNGIDLQFSEVVLLSDGDELRFGRTQFIYMTAESLFDKLKYKKSIDNINCVINELGRINYSSLKALATTMNQQSFVDLIVHPVFMGAALFRGQLHRTQEVNPTNEDKTFQFVNLAVPAHSNNTITMAVLEKAIYILFDRQQQRISTLQSILTIGRDPQNDLTMQDNSISRVHAHLRIGVNGYYLKDNGSTNGTSINNVVCRREEKSIKINDMIQFGRYHFRFLSPADLHSKLNL